VSDAAHLRRRAQGSDVRSRKQFSQRRRLIVCRVADYEQVLSATRCLQDRLSSRPERSEVEELEVAVRQVAQFPRCFGVPMSAISGLGHVALDRIDFVSQRRQRSFKMPSRRKAAQSGSPTAIC